MKECLNLKDNLMKSRKSRHIAIDNFLSSSQPAVWITTLEKNESDILEEGISRGDAATESVVLHLDVEEEALTFAYVASALVQVDKGQWGKVIYVDEDIVTTIDSETDRLIKLDNEFNSSLEAALKDQEVKEDIGNLIDIFILMKTEHNYDLHFVKGETVDE